MVQPAATGGRPAPKRQDKVLSIESFPILRSYRSVPLSAIRIDSSYQRDLDNNAVRRLREDWQPELAGVLILSLRDDALWNVDGQHRAAVMHELGMTEAECQILTGLTVPEEARMFVRYNRNRKNLTTGAMFKAEVTAEEPGAVAIMAIAARRNLRIGGSPLDDIRAVAALRRVYTRGGDEVLGATLDHIIAAWPGDPNRFHGQILGGLGMFVYQYHSEPGYRPERLAWILDNNSPASFLRYSRELAGTGVPHPGKTHLVTEALRLRYNSGLRAKAKLPVPTAR